MENILTFLRRLTVLCMAVLLCLAGTSCGKETEVHRPAAMNINMTDKGTVYDGQEQYFYQVEDSPVDITVSVTKQSGTISVLIFNEENSEKTEYEGHDIPTSEFAVTLTEKGNYEVLVTCDGFMGKYGIDYRKQQ